MHDFLCVAGTMIKNLGAKGMRNAICLAACMVSSLPGVASASSTTTYTYDALGRLIQADTSGTINDGVQLGIKYDAADNRESYSVKGATNKVVVVPLNGFTVIPISD